MTGVDGEPIGERDLLAYVDDRLEPERRRRVEEVLARDPAERARAEAFMAQNEALRRAFGGIAGEPVPPALQAVLEGRGRRARASRGGVTGLAAGLAAGVALAVGLGWWAGGPDSEIRRARTFVEQVATLPKEAAMAGSPLVSTDAGYDAPLDWLEQRVAMDLRAPDLSDDGWTLHRRGLVDVDGRPTVRLVYADDDGRQLSIFMRDRWSGTRDAPDIHTTARGDARAAYWYDGPLVWALVSELEAEQLESLGRKAHASTRLNPMPRGPEMLQTAPMEEPVPPHGPNGGGGALTIEMRGDTTTASP